MGNQGDEDMSIVSIYNNSNYTRGYLETRLFYVRITPCAVNCVPDHLRLCYVRREMGVLLEINGSRVPATDTASITLRRDRVDKGCSEVTYVSTDSIRISGAVEFEVYDRELILLCGSLERVESSWANNGSGWSMDCYMASVGLLGNGGRGAVEVYIAGCCSDVPAILTKTIQVSPKRKSMRQGMLDVIPEDDEVWKEDGSSNGVFRQRKLPITETDMDDYESEGKAGYGFYSEEMYPGEDGQLSWFNAGVRVGVGIGLGMCVGVGIGVGLLMRSYQATTRTLRRRFF